MCFRPSAGQHGPLHTLLALRDLGRRAHYLDGQLERLDELIIPLVTARAPGLLQLYGVGPDSERAACWSGSAGGHVTLPCPRTMRCQLRCASFLSAAIPSLSMLGVGVACGVPGGSK